MPLANLADEIVSLCRRGTQTPVLVTPTYLSLRSHFYAELARQILSRLAPDAMFRIDWLCTANPLAYRLSKFRVQRINRCLQLDPVLAQRASMEVTGAIGRIDSVDSRWILGQCREHQDLPNWVRKIQLVGLTQPLLNPMI